MPYLNPAEAAIRDARRVLAVANIANPATATTTDVANTVNELLNALRTAGILAS